MKTKSKSLKYSDRNNAAAIPPAEASTATTGRVGTGRARQVEYVVHLGIEWLADVALPELKPGLVDQRLDIAPRASEKASRAAKYRLATALESAAVSTTKFMM